MTGQDMIENDEWKMDERWVPKTKDEILNEGSRAVQLLKKTKSSKIKERVNFWYYYIIKLFPGFWTQF